MYSQILLNLVAAVVLVACPCDTSDNNVLKVFTFLYFSWVAINNIFLTAYFICLCIKPDREEEEEICTWSYWLRLFLGLLTAICIFNPFTSALAFIVVIMEIIY